MSGATKSYFYLKVEHSGYLIVPVLAKYEG